MPKMEILLAIGTLVIAGPAIARGDHGGHSSYASKASPGEHMVSGYTTKNGTYVAPHYQTNPDSTRNDNYSTRGNVNPHTGEAGTKPRDEDLAPR